MQATDATENAYSAAMLFPWRRSLLVYSHQWKSLWQQYDDERTTPTVLKTSANTTGSNNTAFGYEALGNNTSDSFNTAFGSLALHSDTTGGHNNTATGYQALSASAVGRANTAMGIDAFQNLSSGDDNTAVGAFAFQNVTTGTGNIGLGQNAGNTLTSGNNNIYIGNFGNSSESGAIRIGTPGTQTLTYIAGTIENPSCNNLTITGGSDLAEPFNITAAAETISEGAVAAATAAAALFLAAWLVVLRMPRIPVN